MGCVGFRRGLRLAGGLALAVSAGAAADPATTNELSGTALNLLVKNVDVVGLEMAVYPSAYMTAASTVFQQVLHPYYAALDEGQRQAILQRMAFHCAENLDDPAGNGHKLAFPVQLLPGNPNALVWHRYACTFTISIPGLLGLGASSYTSPVYTINQLDLRYGAADLEPGVALQNYNLGTTAQPDYAWMGHYVQSLDRMLRDHAGVAPANVIAGVNGGYDYRVDAWAQHTPQDNICQPRYLALNDLQHFYTQHPPPAQCPMDANQLPSCASGNSLPILDDLGDSLVYLTPALRARANRPTAFQSYNCGSLGEVVARGALILYPDTVDARRTPASKEGVADLAYLASGEPASSAIGSGPLLISASQFVYADTVSEEGRPIDNYEVGGQTGVGFERDASGNLILHIVNVDGNDYTLGMHQWLMGLYFLSPYAHSSGAVALGNGGDATLWINPQAPAVQAVLNNPAHANHAYFEAAFVHNSHPGIVSNCSGFASGSIGCSARPLHDGLFLYSR
jgi:hypothetical protein